MISAIFIGKEYLVPFVRSIAPRVEQELYQSVMMLTLKLLKKVKSEKLSGSVLKNRTGTLRRSINQRVNVTPTSVSGIVGTNKEYAAAHEYGFDGQVSVKEHLRTIKTAFGHTLKDAKSVTVSAHTRHMQLPERSFLRSALNEMAADIQAEIKAALGRAVAA